jgi:hypothetical protein
MIPLSGHLYQLFRIIRPQNKSASVQQNGQASDNTKSWAGSAVLLEAWE